MTIRQSLTFDRRLSRANTFYWVAESESIHARIRIAAADEVEIDVPLRFRGRLPGDGRLFCRPLDETTFCTEGGTLHADLPRLELLLTHVPEGPATAMRGM